jgi:hypothetical protein
LAPNNPWHVNDLRYLAACAVGAVVSAAAAVAVAIGGVPLGAVPPDLLVAGACGLLAVEWVLVGVVATVYARRGADEQPARAVETLTVVEAAAVGTPAVEAPVADGPAAVGARSARLPDAGLPDAGLPDAGLPDAGLPDAGLPDPLARAMEERIDQLTAALTLAANATDLHQVGVIAREALATDLRAVDAPR